MDKKRCESYEAQTWQERIRDKHCASCIYQSSTPALNSCDYITLTGHKRGCKPGRGCKKYVKGERLRDREEYRILIRSATEEEREMDEYMAQVAARCKLGDNPRYRGRRYG